MTRLRELASTHIHQDEMDYVNDLRLRLRGELIEAARQTIHSYWSTDPKLPDGGPFADVFTELIHAVCRYEEIDRLLELGEAAEDAQS